MPPKTIERDRLGAVGLDNGLTNYGDTEFARYLRRSFAKSMGYSNESLAKPVVGICYTASGFNNCHRHFPELLAAVERGVLAKGALPITFPMISLGEAFLSPTSMVYRNLMAMAVEEMIRAQPMDSVVLMGGCDKTVPALLMGAASAGKPAALALAGPMVAGRHRGERVSACTDCRRFWARFRAGEISTHEIGVIEGRLAASAGTCSVMGTASSMAMISETIGMAIPGSATVPAVHSDRLRISEATGVLAADMAISGGPTPDQIITKESVENALRVLLAVSGSTNAIIHLTAVAGRLGIEVSLDRLNELSDETPVLVDLKPVGSGYMEDLHAGGGLRGVLAEISEKLFLECKNLEGTTLSDRIADAPLDPVDRNVIRKADCPVNPVGGLIALRGSLAPDGAILKRAAATEELLEHEGRAVVFSSLDDLAAKIDDPRLEIEPDDIMVLQNAGPRSESGMPEAGYFPIPKKLAKQGVTDMIRISDARMSGTAFGTVVLHVTPEADLGGPLALVRNGDKIRLSANSKRIDLLVDGDELRERRACYRAERSCPKRGYANLYYRSVLPAPQGCDFDFLVES
ncbi:MAG: dihydroxy-acid dehydratase [Albidovulum sp.]|nr:dihydroxy-acid dehydratase [Albidovulum sp.]